MIVFAVLALAFLVAWLVPSREGRRPARDAARVAMAVAMVFAGVSHFLMPLPFVQHLPEFVPYREAVIYATGVLEVLFGIGLFGPRRHRPAVALALVAYLVAVFPANVYVAVAGVPIDGVGQAQQFLSGYARLPFQAVYIAWALGSVPGAREVARRLGNRLRGVARSPGQHVAG